MPSSLIHRANDTRDCDADGLLGALRTVTDPRKARGRRYPLPGVLAAALSAVLAGARSFTAIGEWVGTLGADRLVRFGLSRPPTESMIRKLFARLDAAAVDAAMSRFWWTRCHTGDDQRRVIAIDGKTLRGARTSQQFAPHLIAAHEHDAGIVLGQLAVAAKSNEIPAVPELLATFDPDDLTGTVITADALHTQTDTAIAILAAGADYLFTVKANQPTLLAQLKALPWRDVPVHRAITKGRGRRVTRTIKVLQAPEQVTFPGAAQVAQVRRTVTVRGKKTVEVVYLITSAGYQQAQPATLAGWIQGHWGIEIRLRWVRDVTFDEDRSQIRTGAAPQIMASLRNTAINILRLAKWDNIAAGLRHHARNPDQAIKHILTS
ncbi:ISAs1 family transposase [Branchiibius hedensis]|nr:ISAs1 family transposase [Branchiibius hedensis]